MLRECRRVLKRKGRIAGYVIHHAPGLSAAQAARALELGPSEGDLPMPLERLVREAELRLVRLADVTEPFLAMVDAIRRQRARLESALRAEEGDETYEEEQARKLELGIAIREGLVVRTLVVAERV